MSLPGQRAQRDPLPTLLRRAGLLLLLVLIIVVLREVWEVYGKKTASASSRREVELKLADLEAREAALRADIAALKTERGMEEALRREYGVGKEGEGLIVIVEAPTTPLLEESSWPAFFDRLLPWR
jgi:cell division protein FtsB